jgi:CBS domain-containing protein
MKTVAEDLAGKPDVYCLYGARLSHAADIMSRRGVSTVPVVGFIEELNWTGPLIIGVCTARDALMACWQRGDYPYKNKPQNICIQSVMQRDIYHLWGDESLYGDLVVIYETIIEHYRQTR